MQMDQFFFFPKLHKESLLPDVVRYPPPKMSEGDSEHRYKTIWEHLLGKSGLETSPSNDWFHDSHFVTHLFCATFPLGSWLLASEWAEVNHSVSHAYLLGFWWQKQFFLSNFI